MLEDEVLKIQEDLESCGRRSSELTDEFRRGRDASELIPLLDSPNVELVRFAAWVLNEIRLEFYNSEPFVARLRHLLSHSDFTVRFEAFGALYAAMDWRTSDAQALLAQLRAGPYEDMRQMAERVTSQLSH